MKIVTIFMELVTTSIEPLLGGLPVLWHLPGEVILITHRGQAGEDIPQVGVGIHHKINIDKSIHQKTSLDRY
jgi:sulfopyruvate decarboxylase TPP-binding subunit